MTTSVLLATGIGARLKAMVNLDECLEAIGAHLADGSAQRLTYAALECRLAIERICYERLRLSHDYISHAELRRWQPHHVIKILSESVDPHVADDYIFSMGRHPVSKTNPAETVEDFQAQEYVEVGRHIGFKPLKLAKMWNALSRVALHAHLPEHKADSVPAYGEPDAIRKQVEACVAELERISKGTLILTGLGEEVSFVCVCGVKNKRRASLLKHIQVIYCISPDCPESWEVEKDGDEFEFGRRHITAICGCGREHGVPLAPLEALPKRDMLPLDCPCGQPDVLHWKLIQSRRKLPAA